MLCTFYNFILDYAHSGLLRSLRGLAMTTHLILPLRGRRVPEAIQASLILAAFFSLGFHGLLACFLIPSAPKTTLERMATVEVIWERKNTPSQEYSHRNEKTENPSISNENKIMSLPKKPSPIKKVNYKSSVLQDSRILANGVGKEASSAKPAQKMTANRKAHYPLPTYPWVCRKRRQEGLVSLDVKTNADGRVDEVNLHKSSGYSRLDEVAIEAVKTWTFAEGNSQKILILAFRLKG